MGKHGMQWKKICLWNFGWYTKKENICECTYVWIWKYICSPGFLKNAVDPDGSEWGQVLGPFEQENLASWMTVSQIYPN